MSFSSNILLNATTVIFYILSVCRTSLCKNTTISYFIAVEKLSVFCVWTLMNNTAMNTTGYVV